MDRVILLTGTTRGGALEGIGHAFGPVLEQINLKLVEISLLDTDALLRLLHAGEFDKIRFVISHVGMGMDLTLNNPNGKAFGLWQELGIPFVTIHGDSPSYFFDRHIVSSANFISLYAFSEHLELRKRLPRINGPLYGLPPILLDEIAIDQVDFNKKKEGTLIFLKNGKDPLGISKMWQENLSPRVLRALMEMADELRNHLDAAVGNQIDDLVIKYFTEHHLDLEHSPKLRMFLIAQLDDYLRAEKCTRMAKVLMDFPVEIRGNNWDHLDFSGKKATYIDDCNYVDSVGLIRGSLGTIDMSANTASQPHDRPMRAFGAHTLCLTNAGQQFMKPLPCYDEMTYSFEGDSLATTVDRLLTNKSATLEMGVAAAEAFKRLNPPTRAFENMLEYADFTRLDQVRQRPPMLQDFFIWPPALP